MREIKFRFIFNNGNFYATRYKTLDELLDCSFALESMEEDINSDLGISDIEDFVEFKIFKSQYTGLKDKNGVEIYESDIVLDCMTKATMQVKFGQNKNMAYHGWYCDYINLDIRHTSINGDYDTNQNNGIEVIGNIYKNPELLK